MGFKMDQNKDIQADRLILILAELEGKSPVVNIHRSNFDNTIESFNNCSSIPGNKGRMTLVDILYGKDGKEINTAVYVKQFPIKKLEKNTGEYKLGEIKK